MKRIITTLVSVIMFMEFMDTTIINTAVPTIAHNFKEDPILLKFSVTSYFLSLAIFIPISGWFSDKIGTKIVFLFSVTLFSFASLLCGLSSNVIELTCFRFLQGMGGAFMNPVSRIIVIRLFPPNELVRVQGVIFTPALIGFIVGPFVGGLITTYLNWSWIFFINVPIGFAVVYLGYKYLSQDKDENVHKFDFLGFFMSAISVGCISFAIDMSGHWELFSKKVVYATGLIGFSMFFLLVFYCLQKKNPVLDFIILKIKTFRIGLFSCVGMYMVSASVAFLLPLMFQEQFKYTPAYSGTLILPIACAQIAFRFLAPKIIHKLGFKLSMLYSSCLLMLVMYLFAKIQINTSLYYILFVEFLFGMGLVIHMSSTGALNYIDVPKSHSSKATSLDLTSRQFFSSLGVGLSAFFISYLSSHFQLNIASVGGDKIFHFTFLFLLLPIFVSFFQCLGLSRGEGAHALKR